MRILAVAHLPVTIALVTPMGLGMAARVVPVVPFTENGR